MQVKFLLYFLDHTDFLPLKQNRKVFHSLCFSAHVFQKGLPILIGYTVLGFACSRLDQKAGLMPATLFAMRIPIYGDSPEFIGMAMMMGLPSYPSF